MSSSANPKAAKMFSTKLAIASLFALATTSPLALASPQLPTDVTTFPCGYADLTFNLPAGLGDGLDIPLNGVPTATNISYAPDSITITIPVNVDCNFYNARGELVATLPAGVSEVLIGTPQVLPTGVCGAGGECINVT
jgi:hypothetical protein